MHEKMMELFGETPSQESREVFAETLRRGYSLEEISDELRCMEPFLEGFLVAAGGVGSVALLVMTDCSMRVYNAL